MAIDPVSLVSGVSGLAIVTVGYIIALYSFILFLRSRSYQTLALSLTLLCTSSVWMGVAVNFLIYLTSPTPKYLPILTYFVLISWPIGILIPVTMFMTTSFIGEKYRSYAVWISVVVGIIWYIIIVLVVIKQFDINSLFVVDYTTHTLPDSSFAGFELLLTAIGLVVIGIAGILFLVTGRSSTDPVAKLRGIFLGSGYLLFAIASFGDAKSDAFPSEYFLLIIRLLVILSFILMSIAILKPKRIFKT